MDERSRSLLKTLVEHYIADGQPVGSRALSKFSGLDLSPATIHNVMADLEVAGFVASPNTSAGRIPTARKLYTDLSGAYWFLRRSQDGIECLEKSIAFFDRTEHALNSVIAYNNLGINLMLTGDWNRAEQMVKRALEVGLKENYVHVAGIFDSLGELSILREEFDKAEERLERAVAFAEEHNRPWYRVQSMRNLARCHLAKGEHALAIAKATETIELAKEVGDKHYSKMAGLVLAESYQQLGDLDECENSLRNIEDADATSDFFVLGNIQRIRGLSALSEGDQELAIHHFSRGLTIFEAGQDVYQRR